MTNLLGPPGSDAYIAVEKPHPHLFITPRERLLLEHVVNGDTIDVIARTLQVSASTIKNQRKSLYRKLGATSRTEAIHNARLHGLVLFDDREL